MMRRFKKNSFYFHQQKSRKSCNGENRNKMSGRFKRLIGIGFAEKRKYVECFISCTIEQYIVSSFLGDTFLLVLSLYSCLLEMAKDFAYFFWNSDAWVFQWPFNIPVNWDRYLFVVKNLQTSESRKAFLTFFI